MAAEKTPRRGQRPGVGRRPLPPGPRAPPPGLWREATALDPPLIRGQLAPDGRPEGGPPPGAGASQPVAPRPGCKRPRAACAAPSEAQNSLLSLPFPKKLWEIVSSPQFESIRWHSSGTCIVINQKLFEKEILDREGPNKVFETDCVKSFLRQLNLYGFSKMWQDEYSADCLGNDSAEEVPSSEPSKLQFYRSPMFRRDSPQLLAQMQRRTRNRAALKQREGSPQAPPPALAAAAASTGRPEAAGSSTAGLQPPSRPEPDRAAQLPPDVAAALAHRDPVLPTAARRLAEPAARPIAAACPWVTGQYQGAGAPGPLGTQAAPLYLRPFIPFALPAPQSNPYWPMASLAGGRPRGLSAPTSQLSTASVLTWCHPLGSAPIMCPGPARPGLAVPHLQSPFCWPNPRCFPAYRPPPHGPADRADEPR